MFLKSFFQFKEISHAYDILSDEDKRGVYDRFGEEGLNVRHFVLLVCNAKKKKSLGKRWWWRISA